MKSNNPHLAGGEKMARPNRTKRMGYREDAVSREEAFKRWRCHKIGMPREREVSGKQLKRHKKQR